MQSQRMLLCGARIKEDSVLFRGVRKFEEGDAGVREIEHRNQRFLVKKI
jgi:hypothetical protein